MSDKVITQLTPEQNQQMQEYCEKWVKITRNTSQMDGHAAAKHFGDAYEAVNLDRPHFFVLVSSPVAGATVYHYFKHLTGTEVAAAMEPRLKDLFPLIFSPSKREACINHVKDLLPEIIETVIMGRPLNGSPTIIDVQQDKDGHFLTPVAIGGTTITTNGRNRKDLKERVVTISAYLTASILGVFDSNNITPVAAMHSIACSTGMEIAREEIRKIIVEMCDLANKKLQSNPINIGEISYVYGYHDAAWLAYYDFLKCLGFAEKVKKIDPMIEYAQVAGWAVPCKHFAIIHDRQEKLLVDEDRRLHCDDGPAVKWRDGYGAYLVHGVRVPAYVIESPSQITVADIRGEQNAEVRRIKRERFGEGRYLQETNAKLIDIDEVAVDPILQSSKTIHRVLMEDDDGNRFLVGSDGSTNRIYYMRVPNTVKTCSQAYRELTGREDKDCIGQS